MYKKDAYKGLKEEEILQRVKDKGFDPVKIKNTPNYTYQKHKHPETKLLAFLGGSMEVVVDKKKYECEKGDEVIIPGDTYHSAIVGEKGCTFYWSEKLLK